jgi:hypothetical protein
MMLPQTNVALDKGAGGRARALLPELFQEV